MIISPSPAKQIVLAEDNSADALMVRLALEDSGLHCEVRELHDGDEALAYLDKFDADPHSVTVDLFLLDIHLPKHDGEDILNRLRSSHRYAHTPVILMTGSDAPRHLALAQKYAGMHYFRKPSSLAEYMQLGIIVRDLLCPAATGIAKTAQC